VAGCDHLFAKLYEIFLLSSMYTRRVSPQTTFQHRRVDHSVHEVKVRVVFERRANASGIFIFGRTEKQYVLRYSHYE
jgi:hypothetical protein